MMAFITRTERQHQQLLQEIQRLRREQYYLSPEGKSELEGKLGGSIWQAHLTHIHILGTEKFCAYCKELALGGVALG